MGCCVSTNRGISPPPTPTKKQHSPLAPEHSKPRPSLQPLPKSSPPSLEVETVKEILSEEAHKPKPKPSLDPTKYPHLEPLREAYSSKLYHVENQTPKHTTEIEETSSLSLQEESVGDIVSEQEKSEISSTITNEFSYEEDRELKAPRRPKSSQSATSKLSTRPGNNYGAGHRVVGKSPTRRAEQSPVRRANVVTGISGSRRVVQSRDQVMGHGAVRRSLRYDPNRKDPPDGRRSRSPATNRSEMGRSPSAGTGRRTKSPGRVRADPVPEPFIESTKKVEEQMGRVNSNTWTSANGEASGADNYNSNESLENPLVSLECFIFL